jgi:hypothetical protein
VQTAQRGAFFRRTFQTIIRDVHMNGASSDAESVGIRTALHYSVQVRNA